MNKASETPNYEPPTGKNLLIGAAASLGVAMVVLVTFVMPAEYDIDPTGLGEVMGLTVLAKTEQPGNASAPESEPEADPAPAKPEFSTATQSGASDTFQAQQGDFRNEQFEITLSPGQGLEFKVLLSAGETLLYSWDAGDAPLYYDMHGEPMDGPEDFFLSYQEQTDRKGQGAMRAPFEGTHGWYWRNDGDEPATVRLEISGFYRLPGEG